MFPHPSIFELSNKTILGKRMKRLKSNVVVAILRLESGVSHLRAKGQKARISTLHQVQTA
jgi:hypothetical protein